VLSPDELLTTTRAVRLRLDLSRPVPRELLRECVEVALQAPAGGNISIVEFVVVTSVERKRGLGRIYAEVYAEYRTRDTYIRKVDRGTPEANAQQQRSAVSADFLAEHLGECPAIVVGCMRGRPAADADPTHVLGRAGAVMPAMWSFMLAARARGLGTAWTSLHLSREQDVANLLDIPYPEVAQFCMTPVAFTVGGGFSPARRPSADAVTHWDRW
jgi:nitroreductase